MTAVRVRVADGRQVVTDTGHHRGGDVLTVHAHTARQWITWRWAVPVDDEQLPAVPDGPAARHHRANVRARIRDELKTDPGRSDRTVANVVGCDHKTVGAVRKAMQEAGELPQPSDS